MVLTGLRSGDLGRTDALPGEAVSCHARISVRRVPSSDEPVAPSFAGDIPVCFLAEPGLFGDLTGDGIF